MVRVWLTIPMLLATCWGCQPDVAVQPTQPPQVLVESPTVENVPLYVQENGTAEAIAQAVVEARVTGILQKIHYTASQEVAAGDLLFTIEPDDYQDAVKAADANLASAKAAVTGAEADAQAASSDKLAAEAELSKAQADFERAERLIATNSIPQSEFDAARANRDVADAKLAAAESAIAVANARKENAEAAVLEAQAALDQKNTELSRTQVKAPIGGQAGAWKVKEGNLVTAGTPMVEIVGEKQVWVNFSINERLFLDLIAEHPEAEKEGTVREKNVEVALQRNGDKDFDFQGWLDDVDAKFDAETGTLGMRAIFDNLDPQRPIKPGSFVRVRVQVGDIKDAVLVPQRAIGRDQVGSFVFVVDGQNKAQRKNVELGPTYQGNTVVKSGVEPTDRVIVDGLQRVRAGAPVTVSQ